MTDIELQQQSVNQRAKAARETRHLVIPQEPRRKVTFLNTIATLMFTSGLVLIIYVSYLLVYPFNPLHVRSVEVITPIVRTNSALIYRISACKNTQDTPMVLRKIVGPSASEALPSIQGAVSPGCNVTNVPVPIPPGTPTGTYTLYTEVVYHV